MAKREFKLPMLTLDVEEEPCSMTPDMEAAEADDAAGISPRSHTVLDAMLERSVRGCFGEHPSMVERGLFVAISGDEDVEEDISPGTKRELFVAISGGQNFDEEDISPGMKRGRAHFDDEDGCAVMGPTDVGPRMHVNICDDVDMGPTDVDMLHPDEDKASPTSVCDDCPRCPSEGCVFGSITFGSICLGPIDQLSDLSVSISYQRGSKGKPLKASKAQRGKRLFPSTAFGLFNWIAHAALFPQPLVVWKAKGLVDTFFRFESPTIGVVNRNTLFQIYFLKLNPQAPLVEDKAA